MNKDDLIGNLVLVGAVIFFSALIMAGFGGTIQLRGTILIIGLSAELACFSWQHLQQKT